MASLGRILFAVLIASFFLLPLSASAQHLELYDNSSGTWVKTGVVSYSGPVKLTYLGITIPCVSGWNMSLTAGVGNFYGLTQSGSITCAGAVSSNFPWRTAPGTYSGPNPPFTGAPTLLAPLYSIVITGVRIYVPAPLNIYCPSATGSGTITGYMDSGGAIVFKSTLGLCTFETQPTFKLNPSVPVKVVW